MMMRGKVSLWSVIHATSLTEAFVALHRQSCDCLPLACAYVRIWLLPQSTAKQSPVLLSPSLRETQIGQSTNSDHHIAIAQHHGNILSEHQSSLSFYYVVKWYNVLEANLRGSVLDVRILLCTFGLDPIFLNLKFRLNNPIEKSYSYKPPTDKTYYATVIQLAPQERK